MGEAKEERRLTVPPVLAGSQIRRTRIAQELSQHELAALVGCSQGLISQIELGRTAVSHRMVPLFLEALGLSAALAPPERPSEVRLAGASLPTVGRRWRPGVRVAFWQRERESGDVGFALTPSENSLVVCALDVVGHGRRVYPQQQYLAGWLRGRLTSDERAPDLARVAAALEREMQATGAEAAYLLISVSAESRTEHLIETVCNRYPPPLLLTMTGDGESPDDPAMSLVYRGHKSTASPEGRRHGELPQPFRVVVSSPWLIAGASDGLLQRRGGGDEQRGREALRRLCTGPNRYAPLADWAEASEASVLDDESSFVVDWEEWDHEFEFDAAHQFDPDGDFATLAGHVTEHIPVQARPVARQLILELFLNCHVHAYGRGSGVVKTSTRYDERRAQVLFRVSDEGRGGVGRKELINSRTIGRLLRESPTKIGIDIAKNHPRGTIATVWWRTGAEKREGKK